MLAIYVIVAAATTAIALCVASDNWKSRHWCKFVHSWSLWGDVYTQKMYNHKYEYEYVDNRQRRTCKRCGAIDERLVDARDR